MKVTIPTNGYKDTPKFYRMLVLAPNDAVINPLSNKGELSEFHKTGIIKHVAIDALVGDVSVEELSDTLQDGEYNILLIVAHGDADNIILSDEILSGDDLGRLLSQHRIGICLAMSCRSDGFAKDLSSAGVENVISVATDVDNATARKFTREFFRELVRVQDAREAFDYARSRLSREEAAMIQLHCDRARPSTLQQHMSLIVAQNTELRDMIAALSIRHDKQMTSLTNAIFQLASAISQQIE